MQIGGVEIKWTGYSGFFIKSSNKIIYVDPYSIKDCDEKADLILLTHSHNDHCSIADISKIIKQNSRVLLTADCQSKIARLSTPLKIEIVEPGREFNFRDVRISAIPAYNIDKNFHPREEAWVGYVLQIGDVVIYHAGDTDVIPEMQKITGYKKKGKEFVALLPVGGRLTMTPEEALEAAKIIKPTLAIPMYYGSSPESKDNGKEFVRLCEENGINAKVLEMVNLEVRR